MLKAAKTIKLSRASSARTLTFLLHRALCGRVDAASELAASGRDVILIEGGPDWKDTVSEIDRIMAAEGRRVVPFVSISVARHIQRACPHLARGLLLTEDRMELHRWSGVLPTKMLLNRSFILLPLGQLLSRKEQLRSLFGERIFLRPDSSMKPFPGMPIDMDAFDLEISGLRQVYALDDDLLVVVDRGRPISKVEWRCWLADGEMVTHAPYAFDAEVPDGPAPDAILALAREAARRLEAWENPVVADFVLDEEGQPRLLELNAVSTSGFYKGMDLAALAKAVDSVLV